MLPGHTLPENLYQCQSGTTEYKSSEGACLEVIQPSHFQISKWRNLGPVWRQAYFLNNLKSVRHHVRCLAYIYSKFYSDPGGRYCSLCFTDNDMQGSGKLNNLMSTSQLVDSGFQIQIHIVSPSSQYFSILTAISVSTRRTWHNLSQCNSESHRPLEK